MQPSPSPQLTGSEDILYTEEPSLSILVLFPGPAPNLGAGPGHI